MNGLEIQLVLDLTLNDIWKEEEISKNFQRNRKVRCFNHGNLGHLKKTVGKAFLETIPFSRERPNSRPKLSGIGRCGKGQHCTNGYRST